MVGLDFSEQALTEARRLAALAAAEVTFVVADVYDADQVLGRHRFDLVYTGVGALNWLPDIRRWAMVVAELLRPGGRLFLREGHPILWSLSETRADGLLVLEFPYFERAAPVVWEEGGTYVKTDHVFTAKVTHEWNHGLGEVITALLETGMELTMFEEHDSVPWEAMPGQMENVGGSEWRLALRPERLPHSYTLQARRRD
jgi:SAM-dependent methyltransferase